MLDDLRREDAAERAVRQRREIADGVSLGHVEPAGAAAFGHLVIEIDAARRNAARAEEVEKFAAAAADIEHVGRCRRRAARTIRAAPG